MIRVKLEDGSLHTISKTPAYLISPERKKAEIALAKQLFKKAETPGVKDVIGPNGVPDDNTAKNKPGGYDNKPNNLGSLEERYYSNTWYRVTNPDDIDKQYDILRDGKKDTWVRKTRKAYRLAKYDGTKPTLSEVKSLIHSKVPYQKLQEQYRILRAEHTYSGEPVSDKVIPIF